MTDRKLVTIGGIDFELAYTFGAGREISQKIGDPLGIAREAAMEAMMSQAGMAYTPKWMPTVENVPMMLFIGAKHAGMTIKLEQVQEAVFNHGFIEAKDIAMEYLAGIVTPSAREKVDDVEGGGKADAGE